MDPLDMVIELGRKAGFTVRVFFHKPSQAWRWHVYRPNEFMGEGWAPTEKGARICAAAQVGAFVAETGAPFPKVR